MLNVTEEMVLKAKQDTQKIINMMNTCFEKKIETLDEWVMVDSIVSDILKINKNSVPEDIIRAFIKQFNEELEDKQKNREFQIPITKGV